MRGSRKLISMDEKNYLIQFDYGGKTYSIHNLSHHDFSKGNAGDRLWMATTIEDYIRTTGLHRDGAKVSNARLFGKDLELITRVNDFSEQPEQKD